MGQNSRKPAQSYQEYKRLNLPQMAKEVLQFWEENTLFEKTISQRQGSPVFNFYVNIL